MVSANRLLAIAIGLSLTGCGAYSISKPYIKNNYTNGIEIRSHYMANSSPSQITAMAQSNCRGKGFDSASLQDSSRKGEFQSYLFHCKNNQQTETQSSASSGQSSAAAVTPSSSATTKMSITQAKAECKEIGFTVSTEKFADCVMELTK